MIIEEVGVDTANLSPSDLPDNTKFAVVDYWAETYEGGGYVVAFTDKGFELACLEHCSCLGPRTSITKKSWDTVFTVKQFFDFVEDARCYLSGKLVEKVRELYLTTVKEQGILG